MMPDERAIELAEQALDQERHRAAVVDAARREAEGQQLLYQHGAGTARVPA